MTTKASIIPFPRFSHDTHAYSGMTINLSAITHNYKTLCEIVGKTKIAGVVKADAYGAGLAPVTRSLYGVGCRDFFVAYLDEAYEAKQALSGASDANIYVLNGFMKGSEREFTEEGFIPVLTDPAKIERWHDLTAHNKKKFPCVIHLDTGMNRTGIRAEEISRINPLLSDLNVKVVMTHLACSEEQDNAMNDLQKERFDKALKQLSLPSTVIKSFANSGGLFHGSKYYYDMCRTGVALVAGYKDCPNNLKPTIKVWARIYQIQTIQKGDTVGYGCTYHAPSQRKIATLTFGYADGYPAHNSPSPLPHYVMIGSHKAPIIGRISMDLITIDVTDIPEHLVYENAVVELIGGDITIYDVAKWSNRLVYEQMLKFGQRLQRNYVEF